MKSKLAVLFVLSSPLLGGCHVRLPISEAVAVPVAENEAAQLDKQEAPSTPGRWFEVHATLTRDAVRKIARWELYAHLKVEECRTGDLAGVALSFHIEGIEGGDFEEIRRKLDADEQQQTFVIAEPVFLPANTPLDRLCIRLDGGGYTLQKIASSPVRLSMQDRIR